MKKREDRLRLILSSMRVARIEDFETGGPTTNSVMSWNGQLFATKKKIVVYDYVLDEEQKRAVREANELARRNGMVLQVTDLSRQSAASRILRSGLAGIWALLRPGQSSERQVPEFPECDCVSSPVARP